MRTTKLTGSHNLGVFSRTVCAALLSCALTIACSGCQTEITQPVYPDDTASSSTVTPLDDLSPSRNLNTDESDANYAYTEPPPGTAEEMFQYELSLIPFEHLQFLKLRGWKIELTSKNLAEEYNYPSQICGMTDYNKRIIYISSNSATIRRSTIHEVGHAIAYELGWAEEKEEFLKIYEEEKDYFTDVTSIGDGHETADNYEYFASVYQNMILNYPQTRSDVPKTVEYIEECLTRISIFDEDNLQPAHLEDHPHWTA
jgi:hypothetical protein